MQVRIEEDSVVIDGYVNAVERKSKRLISRMGEFVERICKGAFRRALERNKNVRLLLNHDWKRDLGGTDNGSLELEEDNIGLRAHAVITDSDVVQKARDGALVGWSFGFTDRVVENSVENGIPTRDVQDLDLYEVSILDRSKVPAYDGTLVTVRADDKALFFGDTMEFRSEEQHEEPNERAKEDANEDKPIDYSTYENMIKEMREGYSE